MGDWEEENVGDWMERRSGRLERRWETGRRRSGRLGGGGVGHWEEEEWETGRRRSGRLGGGERGRLDGEEKWETGEEMGDWKEEEWETRRRRSGTLGGGGVGDWEEKEWETGRRRSGRLGGGGVGEENWKTSVVFTSLAGLELFVVVLFVGILAIARDMNMFSNIAYSRQNYH